MTGSAETVYDAQPWWFEDAACAGVGWDAFFPESVKGQPADYRAAVRLCKGCKVQDECLAYAIDERLAYGVWGGLTPDERKALRAA